METREFQGSDTARALTPMKAVWAIVLANLLLTAGVVFVWHLWATDREIERNAEEIGVMREEAAELEAHLATLPLGGVPAARETPQTP